MGEAMAEASCGAQGVSGRPHPGQALYPRPASPVANLVCSRHNGVGRMSAARG